MRAFEIPIFTLSSVLFPGGVLALRVFEQRYMDMTKNCLKEGTPFGVCLIRDGPEVGSAAQPEEVGCLARITDWDMSQLGVLDISTVGAERFHILDYRVNPDQLVIARALPIPDEPPQTLPQSHRICAHIVERVVNRVGEKHFPAPHLYDDAVWVGYRLAEILPIEIAQRQQMLEIQDSLIRIHQLHQIIVQRGLTR
ncbi:MAG: LON peptidase substrate-binding domain-containing protein [Burkholderiales bacterium]